MSLPYENATSGAKALDQAQLALRRWGCSRFGVMEDYERRCVIVQFHWRGRDVHLEASWQGYAEAWLREHPYSHRMRIKKHQHTERAYRQASISVYSVLRDWIRGQVTAVEVGLLSFESAFLPHMLLPSGQTVVQHIEAQKLLPVMPAEPIMEGTR